MQAQPSQPREPDRASVVVRRVICRLHCEG